jgi:drug/metabolite transporter (DMT)-like permease
VPVIAAVGGNLFLGEAITLRLILASMAILGGIALVILEKRHRSMLNTSTTTIPAHLSPP